MKEEKKLGKAFDRKLFSRVFRNAREYRLVFALSGLSAVLISAFSVHSNFVSSCLKQCCTKTAWLSDSPACQSCLPAILAPLDPSSYHGVYPCILPHSYSPYRYLCKIRNWNEFHTSSMEYWEVFIIPTIPSSCVRLLSGISARDWIHSMWSFQM